MSLCPQCNSGLQDRRKPVAWPLSAAASNWEEHSLQTEMRAGEAVTPSEQRAVRMEGGRNRAFSTAH